MDGFYKVFFLIIVLTSVLCKADIYPDGGETIEAGKECHIKWDAKVFGSDNVVVSLWMINNSAWNTIGTAAGNTGTLRWIVPYVQGSFFRIKVQSSRDPNLYSVSTTFFSISIPRNGWADPGLDDVQFEILCSPNPASTTVNLSWEGANSLSLSVYSINGDRKYSQATAGIVRHSIPCAHWPSGTYAVELVCSDGKKKYGKFIKGDL
jgi:hypothetical protein